MSFWIKLTFILVEVALVVAFGVTTFTSRLNIAATLEWVIAFIFTFYIVSFFLDLVPAIKTKGRNDRFVKTSPRQMEDAGASDETRAYHRGQPPINF